MPTAHCGIKGRRHQLLLLSVPDWVSRRPEFRLKVGVGGGEQQGTAAVGVKEGGTESRSSAHAGCCSDRPRWKVKSGVHCAWGGGKTKEEEGGLRREAGVSKGPSLPGGAGGAAGDLSSWKSLDPCCQQTRTRGKARRPFTKRASEKPHKDTDAAAPPCRTPAVLCCKAPWHLWSPVFKQPREGLPALHVKH